MKLATFAAGEGSHLGALSGDTLIDITVAGGPASLLEVVREVGRACIPQRWLG
jgi:hypothetical protein